PFACFSVGRSLWLEGRLELSIEWFDRSTDLSPNFAQGIYNRGLVGTMVGDVERANIDLAMALELSPLDPLAYAMVASRALIEVQRSDFEAAAKLGARAAMMTGAHQHIKLIAAFTAQLAGRKPDALYWLQRARATDPRLSSAVFFRSFPFSLTRGRETIEKCLRDLGV
ncbi:MAG: tetratricopeptide repeat protein, partial [Blastomonas fulva]